MKLFSHAIKLIVTIGLLASLSGCAQKFIVSTTGNANQTKFLYNKAGKSGVIKCDSDASGALSNCREMEIVVE